ncbi:restriction endonuclease subunit S [Campylobacter coli]|nr:restriction endonuclease subunit S [Campylobacter coli]
MTNLPQGWEVKTLGSIGFFIRGVSYKKEQLLSIKDEKSVYLLRANNIQNELILDDLQIIPKELAVDKIIQNNDILFAMSSGSKHIVGKNILLNDLNDFTFGAFCGLFRINNLNISYKFLAFYLKSSFYKNYILNISKGSNINNLRFADLENLQIPLPPLKEQERIVGILDESFAKIDESIKILEQDLLNLDELMQSALQKAFNPLKDNAKENYKLPQGWEWKNLGEIANTSSGGTPSRNKKEYWENGNIKWLKSGELNDGYIDFIEENITEEAIKNSSAKIFQKGTLLIAMYGATAGKLGILNLDSTTNQAICAFLHKDKNIKFLEKFLFYFLFFLRDKIIKDSFGGAQPNINQTYIKNLQIPLPPIKEQEQIASHLDELSSHVKNLKQNYQAQIKDLQELKNSLLDKAFKGNL